MSHAPGPGMLQLMVTPFASVTAHLQAFDVDVIHMPPEPTAMVAASEYLVSSRAKGEARRARLSRDLLSIGGGATAFPILFDADMVRHGVQPLIIEGETPKRLERLDEWRFRVVQYLTHKVVPEYERGVVSTVVMADEQTVRYMADYIAERNWLAHRGKNFLAGRKLTPGTTLWFESDGLLLRHVTTTGP